ncbi:hypothetical protein CLOSTHATH_07196 [Hungatella hathewayi DSM 13479]|uniref:Uncharacterized protein n=1 Tax=Hungatella hathewayi DSM 13479 TaxID=566550 RepID=D3AU83_9FIRM|nr:hypothetical protein CLOSTHATH_07196 [Hungatella hathewayi DSM 13479]
MSFVSFLFYSCYEKRPQALHRLATTAIQDSISLFAINSNHNPYK